MLKDIQEMRELKAWLGNPPRSPVQTHGLNEADAEVLRLGGGRFLAAKVDAISEEIQTGLYSDGYTAGWLAAMGALSDLAAVGASPLGVLFSTEWGPDFPLRKRKAFGKGASQALRASGTYWLGGDSGRLGTATAVSATAVGTVDKKPLSRMGILPGDLLVLTGRSGMGPAFGARFLLGEPSKNFAETLFRPKARLDAGRALLGRAHACMDTSDGVLSTLDTLSKMNGVGFQLRWNPGTLDSRAVRFCEKRGLPLWLLWALELGDYQLVAAIPKSRLRAVRARIPDLNVIGTATARMESEIEFEGRRIGIDLEAARRTLNRKNRTLRESLEVLIPECRRARLP